MKGGYFILDCRNYQPTADNTSLTITDEEFKKDFIAAGKSGKPVLFTNFRNEHGPNFGEIHREHRSDGLIVLASVSTTLGADLGAIEYIWYYSESTNEFTVSVKPYNLSN